MSKLKTGFKLLAILLVALLILAACGTDDENGTSSENGTPAPAPAPVPEDEIPDEEREPVTIRFANWLTDAQAPFWEIAYAFLKKNILGSPWNGFIPVAVQL